MTNTLSPREALVILLGKMRPLLLTAGIPAKQTVLRYKSPKTETCANAFDWLHDLYMSPEYAKMKEAWARLPEKTWLHYELFQIDGLIEQELLQEASRQLRKCWRLKRPRLFGRENNE